MVVGLEACISTQLLQFDSSCTRALKTTANTIPEKSVSLFAESIILAGYE